MKKEYSDVAEVYMNIDEIKKAYSDNAEVLNEIDKIVERICEKYKRHIEKNCTFEIWHDLVFAYTPEFEKMYEVSNRLKANQ